MDDAKQQLAEKLKTANNILVTVSRDPSVDQLASCIGLTLLLNKQGKHAAAVFSGNVPSTLEFLQPEETIEKNTDSLRDFIIALDKSKADKLRYKVEDNVVRIFITPYKTSISQADLEFSEGDFNVDLVIALGVQQQEDLDEAITAHGRILHDATVACINTSLDGGLGSINWNDPQASSLCELITELASATGAGQFDEQIATALLTGIVAETNRFSNDKTSSQTMSASAALMNAGANQQLVASKLSETPSGSFDGDGGVKLAAIEDDGTMEINHSEEAVEPSEATEAQTDSPADQPETFDLPTPSVDGLPSEEAHPPKLMTEPPSLGGQLTANSASEQLEQSIDPLGVPSQDPPQLLDRKPEPLSFDSPADSTTPNPDPAAAPPAWVPPAPAPINIAPNGELSADSQPPAGPAPDASPTSAAAANPYSTLSDLEEAVQSPHVQAEHMDEARDEVSQAFNDSVASAPELPNPIEALNAQPLGEALHPDPNPVPMPEASVPPMPITPQSQVPTSLDSSQPTVINPAPVTDQPVDPNAPPPVPPPIPFQFGNPPQSQ
ncbi:MAG: hypothetical protein AAB436_00820 [Patescibacteria group bacterium]